MKVDIIDNTLKNEDIGILFIPGWIKGTFESIYQQKLTLMVQSFEEILREKKISGAKFTYKCGLPGNDSARVQKSMVEDIQQALEFCRHEFGWKRIRIFAKGGSAWLVSKAGHNTSWGIRDDKIPSIERLCFFEPIPDVSSVMKQSLETGQTNIKGINLPENYFRSFIGEPPLWHFLDENAPPTLVIAAKYDQFCEKKDIEKMEKVTNVNFIQPEGAVGHNMLEDKTTAPELESMTGKILDSLLDGM